MLGGGAGLRGVVRACRLLINNARQVMTLTVFDLLRFFFFFIDYFCCATVAHLAGTRATAQMDSSSSSQQHPTGSQT